MKTNIDHQEKVKVVINSEEVEAEGSSLLIEVALKAGIEIPHLCYNPFLKPYGSCRLCIVEVEEDGKRQIVTSCNYPVTKPIKVTTESEKLSRLRAITIELLLCKAPECEKLKQYASKYGIKQPRLKTQRTNCILCGLCVRACEQLVGVSAITFEGRGAEKRVNTPFGKSHPKCISCAACAYFCPTGHIKLEDIRGRKVVHEELTVGYTSAVYTPTRQPVPPAPVIDSNNCIHFQTGGCSICETVCEKNAINFNQKEEKIEVDAGAIIVATGYETFNPSVLEEYGYGRFANVVTAPEIEKMSNASGPTGGEILLADGNKPLSTAIIHCVGSRDHNTNSYCSKVCCMYSIKLAHLIGEKTGGWVTNFYIDIRATGKGYEEFYETVQNGGVRFIRGRVIEVRKGRETNTEEAGKLVVVAEDTLLGEIINLPVDMVVLSVGIVPRRATAKLAEILKLQKSTDGFLLERHIKLAPSRTFTDGIFIAGTAQGPKDISESVLSGQSAGLEAMSLLDRRKVELEPSTAHADEYLCSGCGTCEKLCLFEAIKLIEEKNRIYAVVEEERCAGCGLCSAGCPSGAIDQKNFTNNQILSEINGLFYSLDYIVSTTGQ